MGEIISLGNFTVTISQHKTNIWKSFRRYDYEECALEPCNEMMEQLEKNITDPSFTGKDFSFGGKTYKVKVADNFSYTDPVDKSVSTKQVK